MAPLHDIGHQISVREHHSLRRTGHACRILDQRQIIHCRPTLQWHARLAAQQLLKRGRTKWGMFGRSSALSISSHGPCSGRGRIGSGVESIGGLRLSCERAIPDEAGQPWTLVQRKILPDIGEDHLTDTRVGTDARGHDPAGLQDQQDLGSSVADLATKLLLMQQRVPKDNDRPGLERAIKGDDTLRNIGQDNRDTISRGDAQSPQCMRKAIAQVIQLAVTYLLPKEDDGRMVRKRARSVAEQLMQELLRLRNLRRYPAIIVLEPGHVATLGSKRRSLGPILLRALLLHSCPSERLRRSILEKATDGSTDGIWSLKDHHVSGDRDLDQLNIRDIAQDTFESFAPEDAIAMPQDDERGDPDLLLHPPGGEHVISQPLECPLWSGLNCAKSFAEIAKEGVRNDQQFTQAWGQGEVRGHADQHQAVQLLGVANSVFAGNSAAKGMPNEMNRSLDLQSIQDDFQVIDQAIHGIGKSDGIIAQYVATLVGGKHPHALAEEAQLVEPVRGTAPVAVHEEKSPRGSLGVDVDHADTPGPLCTACGGRIDGAAIEFDIEWHMFPPLPSMVC